MSFKTSKISPVTALSKTLLKKSVLTLQEQLASKVSKLTLSNSQSFSHKETF